MKTKRMINTKLKMMVAQRSDEENGTRKRHQGDFKASNNVLFLKGVLTIWVFTVLFILLFFIPYLRFFSNDI